MLGHMSDWSCKSKKGDIPDLVFIFITLSQVSSVVSKILVELYENPAQRNAVSSLPQAFTVSLTYFCTPSALVTSACIYRICDSGVTSFGRSNFVSVDSA